MTVERMIELLEIEKECVLRNASGECNRYCAGCDLLQDDTELHEMYTEAIALLKAQEQREPHYTKLEYIVNGMPVAINHPECPRCYDNGLVLWDAEIEKGAAYCKRCGQAVKWE